MDQPLPRLLYIGDVPVEASYHGSALLFRLLQGYSSERLHVIEGDLFPSLPDRRLPDVPYRKLSVGRIRILRTRLHQWYSLLLSARSFGRASRVPLLLDGFIPEAVLTVAHGHSWMTAAEFARKKKLPLHLIVHDDWPRMARLPGPARAWLERQFGRVYREAASRLCVSPFMVQEYIRRYGVEGQVLYPSRAPEAKPHAAPPERLRETRHGIVFAFAGTINMPDYCRLLRMLAECLEPHGGRLLIYSPLTAEQAALSGLKRTNIHLCGLLKSAELLEQLRRQVDVLFVPISFALGDRANMEISFPSKLTDYTAVGLPILIAGPQYCSAVRWAHENPGVADVVDQDNPARLAAAIGRLVNDIDRRISLAKGALAIGSRFFSPITAQRQLYEALSYPTNRMNTVAPTAPVSGDPQYHPFEVLEMSSIGAESAPISSDDRRTEC